MPDPTERLRIEGLSASVGGSPVLRAIDLRLADGELLSLLGPNGSGKTTLLRCLAGFERPSAGRIWLDGEEITRRPPHRRGVGLLLQEPALLPRRTVLENVAYGPLVQGMSVPEARALALEALDHVRLRELAGRDSSRLSGGERQRVALARAIAARPRVILLDEPFASIDPEVRGELSGEFRQVLGDLEMSAIHVTHDRAEGLFLGDRVAVLLEGEIRAVGSPEEVYRRPESARVARFLGYNVLRLDDALWAVDPALARVVPPEEGTLVAQLLAVGTNGRERIAYLLGPSGERIEARAIGSESPLPRGARLGVRWSDAVRLAEP